MMAFNTKTGSKRSLWFSLSLFAVCLPFYAEAATTTLATTTPQSPRTLLFLGNQNIAPVVYLEGTTPSGVAVDIVKALAKHIPEPIDIKAMDWPTAQSLVAEGKADALIQINSTEARRKIYDFSEPLLESHFSIFTNSNRIGIVGIPSLEGLRVGVEAGGLPQQLLSVDPQIELVTIPNFLDAFKQINEGALDAVVVDERVGLYTIAKNNLRDIKTIGDPIAPSYSAFAVKKGNAELLNQINAALQKIRSDGTYQAIINKWTPTEVVIQTQEQITHNIFLSTIAVLAIIALLILAWSITIKRELSRTKKAESEVIRSSHEVQDLYDNAPCGYHSLNKQGVVVRMNETELKWLGYAKEEVIGKLNITKLLTPESIKTFQNYFPKFKETGLLRDVQLELTRKDGSILPVMISATAVTDEQGNYVMSRSTVYDMTEQRKAELEIVQKNHALRMLSETNQALIHATTEQALLNRICDIMVTIGGYQSVWIGYRNAEDHSTIQPIAQSGLLPNPGIEAAQNTQECSPCSIALNTKKSIIINDIEMEETEAPWKQRALEEGYRSLATFPLTHNGEAFGVMGVYATHTEIFSEGVVRILQEAADDLSFGIHTVRTKVARERAEDELADERNLFVGGPTVVFKWRAEEGWPVEYVSPNIFKQFGYTQDDLTSGRFTYPSIIHPNDLKRIAEEVENYSKQGVRSFEQTYRIARKDGEYRWINDYTSVSHRADGTIDYYNGYVIDVTDKKESEEQYKTLIQKIQTAVVVHSANTKIITSNSIAQDLLGLTEDQLFGKTAFDPSWNFFHENGEIAKENEYPVNIVLSSRSPIRNYILRVHRPNKENDVWVLVNADPVFDEQNELTQIIVSFVDITERKQAEEEIVRSEERFSAAFHASPDMIAITELSTGKIIDVNESYESVLGYTRGESIGKTTAELSIWADQGDRTTFVTKLKEQGQVTDFETKLRRKDGKIITAIDSARTITLNGEPCILSIINDITERKEAERKLLEQEQYSQSLLRFSRKLEQSQAYEEILVAASKEIDAIIGYAHVWAYTFTDDNKYLHKISAVSPTKGNRNELLIDNRASLVPVTGDPMLEALVATKEIVVVTDAQTDPTVNHELVKELGNRTIVNVPIILSDRNLGIIGMGTFGDEGVRVPSKENQKYLVAMASHIAVAFDRIRLLNEERQTGLRLLEQEHFSQSLLRFSRKVEQSQKYGEILKAAQDEIKTIIGFNNVWAYTFDADKKQAHSIAAIGEKSDVVLSEEYAATLNVEGDPMMEAIASAKEIILVEDAQTDPHVNKEIVAKLKNRTIVNVPIRLFNQNLGSIGMGTFGDEGVRVPTKEEQEFLVAMASHIAVGFDRIRLLNEEREKETELKKREEELEQANLSLTREEARDKALLESLGEGIIAIDKQGRIVATNHAAEKTLGWKESELVGKDLIEAVPAVDENGILVSREKRLAIAALEARTETETGTLYYIHRSGTRVPVAITATPFILNGKVIGAVNVFHDVTKEKELEETRKDLLSLASHQLRTPLSGTKWLIETLQKGLKGPLNKDQQEYLDEIYRINERMTTLVHDMLGVLRMESGTIPSTITPTPASTIVSTEIDNLSAAAKKKGLTLKVETKNDHVLNTDPALLGQLLEVFISNAITYSESGKEVIITLDKTPQEIIFTVKDSGIGIPQEEQDRIFQRFYRASNAKTFDTRGTGLGLHIATILAKKLGATLSFESKQNVGSTFFIRMPIVENTRVLPEDTARV